MRNLAYVAMAAFIAMAAWAGLGVSAYVASQTAKPAAAECVGAPRPYVGRVFLL